MGNSTPYLMLKQAALSIALVTLGFTTNIHAADFAPVKSLTVGADPSSLASGDLNGDGFPDLAVANYADGTVSVLLGEPGTPGNFGSAPPISLSVPTLRMRQPGNRLASRSATWSGTRTRISWWGYPPGTR